MTAPISVAPEEARKDYIATCFKMTHAELFQELMRVHQAAGQLMDEQVRRAEGQAFTDGFIAGFGESGEGFNSECGASSNDIVDLCKESRNKWMEEKYGNRT